MENKVDLKAIMAQLNSTVTNLPSKNALHPCLSTRPPAQPKKPVLETSLSGNSVSTLPKPSFLKNSASTKSAPEAREPPNVVAKALAGKFSNPGQDDGGGGKPSSFVKQFPFNQSAGGSSQEAESKSPVPRPPLHKPLLSHAPHPESRPAFPKPLLASVPKPPSTGVTKPPWVKDDAGGGSPHSPPPRLPPLQKPISSLMKTRLQDEDGEGGGGATADPASSSRPFPSPAPKPSNFRTAQGVFSKDVPSDDSSGGRGEGGRPVTPPTANSPPPRPPANKKPSFVRRPPPPSASQGEDGHLDDPSAPKRNPLPNIWALGHAPAKPNRPPRVNLESVRRGSEAGSDGPAFKKSIVPPPPASHPGNMPTPPLPPPSTSHPSNLPAPPLPTAPTLPPRPSAAIIQPDQDEYYDDIGTSRTGESSSEEEMYEDLDDRWGPAELKEQEKKREKEEKKRQEEEKKRQEAEKREQKERDRKEQEARKKFKLSGPMPVIHSVKARVDSKGGRTDLALRQDESIDIVRVLDNPEGRWLGRTKDGTYGYVKTELVQIDFDVLKRQGGALTSQQNFDQDVYDDVECSGGINGPGVVLPPPPEDDGDLYDDLDTFDMSPPSPPRLQESRVSTKARGLRTMLKQWRRSPGSTTQVPPPPQFTPEGNSDQSAADQEIYDDIETPEFPPPPPASSLPQLRPHLPRMEEMDPKKLKKFEKEEKEFRKKFKFEGEVVVLYQVTIVSTLPNKKWGGKDLQLTPREKLDVVVKAVDNKLVCRNNDGKFGYVHTSNIVVEDADIYDDIGDDCIYDND